MLKAELSCSREMHSVHSYVSKALLISHIRKDARTTRLHTLCRLRVHVQTKTVGTTTKKLPMCTCTGNIFHHIVTNDDILKPTADNTELFETFRSPTHKCM